MSEREPDGRFARGNKIAKGNGGGRPRRATEERYLKALSDTVTLDDWIAIAQRAIEQAKQGNDRARRWLSDYLIGKPTEYQVVDANVESDNVVTLLDEIRTALSQ